MKDQDIVGYEYVPRDDIELSDPELIKILLKHLEVAIEELGIE